MNRKMNFISLRKNFLSAFFADFILTLISVKSNSAFAVLLFTCILYILGIIILFINFWTNKHTKYIKATSLITFILSLIILITQCILGINFKLSTYSYFSSHEKMFIILSYLIILCFILLVIFKKIYDFQVNKLDGKNKRNAAYIILGIFELLIIFSVYKRENFSIETLKINTIYPPKYISVSTYENENQKIVNNSGQLNTSQNVINHMIYNKAKNISDSNKINEITNILNNKKCSLVTGLKRTKLYSINYTSSSYEISNEDTYDQSDKNINFYGMKILGDGNVIFETFDTLSTNGKIQGKKDSSLHEYIVDLTDEEKHNLLNLVK